jgi:RNA polymerase primary sigma factor
LRPERRTLEKKDRQTPLLDLPEAAVKELVRTAKNAVMLNTIRLTALLATEEVSSGQIENILAKYQRDGHQPARDKEARREKEVAA